ncbi:hypothetical protein ACIGO8_00070 [Streptomyces sp. NPDC053493]|uniref:hypothetical protein n=1 Tax=Streptomyces sp. NPDC053493 TaxID=3365705 RepID=UPI0037CECB01
MTGGEPDLAASKEALNQIATGLTGVLAELKELGMVGEAGMGRGFSDLGLTGMETGHDGLSSSLKTYCERWEWGVRSLVQKGSLYAKLTGLSAGTFHEQEQYIGGAFKVLTNSAMGNPYASEDEITKKDWGDVLSSNTFTHIRDADYSQESFDRAGDNIEQAWKNTAWDVSDSPMVMTNGIIDAAGLRDDLNDRLEQTLGPRQQPGQEGPQAEQQGGGR